jgi:hypothetical protein
MIIDVACAKSSSKEALSWYTEAGTTENTAYRCRKFVAQGRKCKKCGTQAEYKTYAWESLICSISIQESRGGANNGSCDEWEENCSDCERYCDTLIGFERLQVGAGTHDSGNNGCGLILRERRGVVTSERCRDDVRVTCNTEIVANCIDPSE